MKLLGNIIWFIFGGFFNFVGWSLVGLLWYISIIGIPVGLQCFKMAKLSAFPFGKQIQGDDKATSLILNILWIVLGGFGLALMHVFSAIFLCFTIIGIPFAGQQLKLARLALMPFGAKLVNI